MLGHWFSSAWGVRVGLYPKSLLLKQMYCVVAQLYGSNTTPLGTSCPRERVLRCHQSKPRTKSVYNSFIQTLVQKKPCNIFKVPKYNVSLWARMHRHGVPGIIYASSIFSYVNTESDTGSRTEISEPLTVFTES